MHVACVGDCGLDIYRPSDERRIGGITANFARHARVLFPADDRVHVISCIGDDEAGSEVLRALERARLELDICRLPGATPIQNIEIQPDGERRFVGYEAGVLGSYELNEGQQRAVSSSDLVVTPVYQQILPLFESVMSCSPSGTVAVDFSDFAEHPDFDLLDHHLAQIDIAFFGLTSARRDLISALADRCQATTVVVTLGADGSLVLSGDLEHSQPAVSVPRVIDTTGAGDAFAAAFLSRFCHGAAIGEAAGHAAEIASRVVSRVGTGPNDD